MNRKPRFKPSFRPRSKHAQRGVTMLVTLVLLTVMVLGGLALARMAEIGSLATGNAAYREAALQASEVGINNAFQSVRAMTNEGNTIGTWYWPAMQAQDSSGIPSIDWTAAPETLVGVYSVRWVVERACNTAAVVDALRECLNKTTKVSTSQKSDGSKIDPPSVKQFRITVRVTGPKDTQTWVQSLVTRG